MCVINEAGLFISLLLEQYWYSIVHNLRLKVKKKVRAEIIYNVTCSS